MADVLVDTDVFVDHLRGAHRLEATDRIHYSTITRAELLAGPAAQHDAVRILLGPLNEHEVSRPVAEIAGAIRSALGVPLPDALIAATALRLSLPVVTRNRKHFEPIDGLSVRAPAAE
jgi:toxin FitB